MNPKFRSTADVPPSTPSAEKRSGRSERRFVDPASSIPSLVMILSLLWISLACPAATIHVWQDSTNPQPPYSTWDTAARVLQDAVDAAQHGDTVLVTNGVYTSGGRSVRGAVTNRVAVRSGITVRSVSGPAHTIIEGAATPSIPGILNKTGNGDGAVRCAYLSSNAVLSGFTLRNGHTRTNGVYDTDQSGGGAWCELGARLIECVLTNNAAHHMGGGAFRGELQQSFASGNLARYGGAACLATISDSVLVGNSAENGGGAYMSRITRSIISTNNANVGGGVMGGSALDCTLIRNTAGQWGGGASQATLQRCRIEDNLADRGGGVFLCTVFGSVISANTADLGGGAAGGTLRHCTVTGNTGGAGGGVYLSSVANSIIHFNLAVFGPNHDGATIQNSCTTPLPEDGTGNLDADPQLATPSHTTPDSPCIAHDSIPPELGTDLDGEAWRDPSSMGADQYLKSEATGPLVVAIPDPTTTVAKNHPTAWRIAAEGKTTGSQWDFGDGTVVRNQPWARHTWATPGEYVVTLTVFNQTFPEGVSANVTVRVIEPPVLHVAPTSRLPTSPYASWDTASPTIQGAIDAATVPGSVILVTNGVYSRGGASLNGDILMNRVAITKPVVVRSVNGPEFTRIVGGGPLSDFAVRCAYVGRDAHLSGFTLTNGYTRTLGSRPREQRGAGVYGEASGVVSNCVLTGNLARAFGGGANRGTLVHCQILSNQSLDGAGGVHESILQDCVIQNNRAANTGGGASRSLLTECLITANSAPVGAGSYYGTLDQCRLERNLTEGDGYGGGAHGGVLTDCLIRSNAAYVGGGAYLANLRRCRIEANEARREGGGVANSTVDESEILENSASYGGGSALSQITRSTLSRNVASVGGGAADRGELEDCLLVDNESFYGGASQHATLRRCRLRGNSAVFGGAGYRDLQYNCLLTGNTATNQGGATFQSQLIHCTVSANAAEIAGGTFEGTNRNSIIYFNTALASPDQRFSVLVNSCTSPTPDLLPGTVTAPPLFLQPSSGDYRLRAGSPCIDSGADLHQFVGEDLDGTPRPLDGNGDGIAAFDIGALEYDANTMDSDLDGVPDAWYLRYGLDPGAPGVSQADPDQDKHSNYHEWIAGTVPTDPDSAFSVFPVSHAPSVKLHVRSLVGREYTLLARSRLPNPGDSSEPWQAVPGSIRLPGTGEILTLTDTNRTDSRYYQVTVDLSESSTTPTLVRRTSRPQSSNRTRSIPPSVPQAPLDGTDEGDPGLSAGSTPFSPRHPIHWLQGESLLSSDEGTKVSVDTSEFRRPRAALHATGSTQAPFAFRIPFGNGIPISPMLRGQEPFMLYAASARKPTLELGRGSTFRGVAGGTDAETYNWKDLSASTRPHDWSYHPEDPPVVTTLEWLEQARDYDAELVLTVNTRGHGRTLHSARAHRIWSIEPRFNRPDYVAQLAADWVRYVNRIVPAYRMTPEGQLPSGLSDTDPEAHRILEELKAFGNGTNAWTYRLATAADPDTEVGPALERPFLLAHDAPPLRRKVTYWEIGNEVETPMNVSDPRGERIMEPGINLTPSQYVERYLRITEAMRRVDPTIRVGPCPNNPWGPKVSIENEHLIQLLAHPDAVIDVFYYHYYNIWSGDYFRPADVNRNLRVLKNYAYQLASQYAAHFARAGRPPVPTIISEWNPDYTIHPPVERNMLSALATAEVFMSFVELQILGAHYWENPDGRASAFVFDRLRSHLGDRFLGSAYGDLQDDGSHVGFGPHPSASTDIRIYATQRSEDSRIFLWLMNLSDTRTHTVDWSHPHPLIEARSQSLRNPAGATTFYTPVSQLRWIADSPRTNLTSSSLPPSSLSILELTYDTTDRNPAPPVISSLSDVRGPVDLDIVIFGKAFSTQPDENTVHFGLGRATVIAAEASSLRVRVPASATYGPVTVTTRGRTAYSREYFCLAANPGQNTPLQPDSLVPLYQQLYPPEGAPIVSAPVDLHLADWQGSGQLQLVGLTSRSGSVLPHTIDLFRNESTRGQPWFATPICNPQTPRCSLPLNSSPARVAMGDLDGDGLLDLACADRHAWQVAVWRNAHPSTNHSFDVNALLQTGRSPSAVAVFDLDLDARPDLVAANTGDNSISVLPNLTAGPGSTVFGIQRVLRTKLPDQMLGPHAVALGDVVGDTRPDIVVAGRSTTSLTLFRGDGAPGEPAFVEAPAIPADRVESLALGDLDGDGRLEMVVAGQWPNGGITIWRNDGSDRFSSTAYATTKDPRQMKIADINGDGLPDIVTVNNDTSSVSVFRNTSTPGSISFAERSDFPMDRILPNDPICLTTGDLDGDGRTDVAIGHYYSGFITFLHNRSSP